KLTSDAADERARHEHGAQHQTDGDNRPRHFFHGLDGGGARFVAARNHAFDVLQHDDGVVHHNADGQHETKQRDVIEAEIHQSHDGEGADDRYGDVDHGQDHGSPILQEKQHHHAD